MFARNFAGTKPSSLANFRNFAGRLPPQNPTLLLETCSLEVVSKKGKCTVAALVFNTAEKTASNAWLLGIKHIDHEQAVATMYKKGTHTFHLSLNTSLGEQIISLLSCRRIPESVMPPCQLAAPFGTHQKFEYGSLST